jgi:hypothetical protein
MYLPLLADEYRSMQAKLAAGVAQNSVLFELTGHSLRLPTGFATRLLNRSLDAETFWKDTVDDREPLESPYAAHLLTVLNGHEASP